MYNCQGCGARGPTQYVEFYQNIGLLILRLHKSLRGHLCRSCLHHYFWEYTLITFFGGWWGIISFFVTPFLLLNNTIRYVGCLLQPVADPAGHPSRSSDQEDVRARPGAPRVVAHSTPGASPGMIHLRCPHCQEVVAFDRDVVGLRVKCPECYVPVQVPVGGS